MRRIAHQQAALVRGPEAAGDRVRVSRDLLGVGAQREARAVEHIVPRHDRTIAEYALGHGVRQHVADGLDARALPVDRLALEADGAEVPVVVEDLPRRHSEHPADVLDVPAQELDHLQVGGADTAHGPGKHAGREHGNGALLASAVVGLGDGQGDLVALVLAGPKHLVAHDEDASALGARDQIGLLIGLRGFHECQGLAGHSPDRRRRLQPIIARSVEGDDLGVRERDLRAGRGGQVVASASASATYALDTTAERRVPDADAVLIQVGIAIQHQLLNDDSPLLQAGRVDTAINRDQVARRLDLDARGVNDLPATPRDGHGHDPDAGPNDRLSGQRRQGRGGDKPGVVHHARRQRSDVQGSARRED